MLFVVVDSQSYKLQKTEENCGVGGGRRTAVLAELVQQCAARLRSAVDRVAGVQCAAEHRLHSLLQQSSSDSESGGVLLSVSSTEQFVAYETLSNGDCALALCTPLMKRVHRLVPHAADIVAVDVGLPVDKRRHCRVIILTTNSSAGGLPLGVIATTSDSILQRSIELYASLLDSRCFYGRGVRGPTLLLVDDCPLLIAALCAVFTSSSCLLCTYRLLLSYWRELWDRRSAVATDQHRAHCFALFEAAVFSDTVDQLHANFANVQSDLSMVSQSRVISVYERRMEWSVCCQKRDWSALNCLRTAGSNRNLCVCASRALKDAVLGYIKSMKTLDTLLTFVCERCDSYYERRLTDTVTGRLYDASALRFMQEPDVGAHVMSTALPSHYEVTPHPPSTMLTSADGGTCHVELSVGLCSCSVGCSGGACIHLWTVVLDTQARSWLLSPVSDIAARRVLAHVASGLGCADAGWFAPSLHPLQSDDMLLLLCDDNGDVSGADEAAVELLTTATVAESTTAYDKSDSSFGLDAIGNKHVIINWNGLAYEVSLQQPETPIVESNNDDASAVAVSAPSRDRLRQSLTKIENAYVSHPDVMEPAVTAFCQTVESTELLEHLNSALLCFGNSFLTSGYT